VGMYVREECFESVTDELDASKSSVVLKRKGRVVRRQTDSWSVQGSRVKERDTGEVTDRTEGLYHENLWGNLECHRHKSVGG